MARYVVSSQILKRWSRQLVRRRCVRFVNYCLSPHCPEFGAKRRRAGRLLLVCLHASSWLAKRARVVLYEHCISCRLQVARNWNVVERKLRFEGGWCRPSPSSQRALMFVPEASSTDLLHCGHCCLTCLVVLTHVCEPTQYAHGSKGGWRRPSPNSALRRSSCKLRPRIVCIAATFTWLSADVDMDTAVRLSSLVVWLDGGSSR
jgi:hypothetical protein